MDAATGNPSHRPTPPANAGAPLTHRTVGPVEAFTLAHLSDPHLTDPTAVRPWDLLNKRLLGFLSWHRNRRHEHRPEVVDALLRDIEDLQPDHLVITGDLTHLGTPLECRQARAWLHGIGRPENVTVVPGNHDTYVADDWQDTVGQWAAYMRGDRQAQLAPDDFPCIRRRGAVALIGVNTARPTAPLLATGRVGELQLERLGQALLETRDEGLCRILLLHHPVSPDAVSRRKALDDASALRDLLGTAGAELVLHGHGHKQSRMSVPGPSGTEVPVFAAPSASAIGEHSADEAGYYRFRLTRPASSMQQAAPWQLCVDLRSYDQASRGFVSTDRQSLTLPAPAQARSAA